MWKLFDANVVLNEDKASGTRLIQELIADGCHGMTRYEPTCEKIMRLHAQTALIPPSPAKGDRAYEFFSFNH